MDNDVVIKTWASDASGDATVDFTGHKGKRINWVKTIPDAGVSSYNLTLTDEDDFDWLIGEGSSRSTTDSEIIFASSLIILPNDTMTFVIAGAGNVKTGTIKISVK